jgi:hypothetical protein
MKPGALFAIFGSMRFDSQEAREAYQRGAWDAYESAFPFVDARQERALLEWLRELDSWQVGDPPAAPAAWEDASEPALMARERKPQIA